MPGRPLKRESMPSPLPAGRLRDCQSAASIMKPLATLGIVTAILGTGMRDVHRLSESADLEEMVRTTELVVELVRLHSRGQ